MKLCGEVRSGSMPARASPLFTPTRASRPTNAAQIRAAAQEIDALDALINNAGISLQNDLGDRAALERLLAVNLFGKFKTHFVVKNK
jgi:NAD(P)-dependent dehydrogenase (short-subunit alcohol dehydrogenase family)